jgi:hypothetical protein
MFRPKADRAGLADPFHAKRSLSSQGSSNSQHNDDCGSGNYEMSGAFVLIVGTGGVVDMGFLGEYFPTCVTGQGITYPYTLT